MERLLLPLLTTQRCVPIFESRRASLLNAIPLWGAKFFSFVPISALVGGVRNWYKKKQGLSICGTLKVEVMFDTTWLMAVGSEILCLVRTRYPVAGEKTSYRHGHANVRRGYSKVCAGKLPSDGDYIWAPTESWVLISMRKTILRTSAVSIEHLYALCKGCTRIWSLLLWVQ